MSVHVLALPDLQSCAQDVLGGEVVPRSLLYNTLGNEHYLLGGLGDGHLVIWRFDPASRQLSQRKRVPLATQPGTTRTLLLLLLSLALPLRALSAVPCVACLFSIPSQ